MNHAVTVKVRYGETDKMGIVYHPNYLAYFELGRTEFMRASGFPYREIEAEGVYLVVVEAACIYKGRARYDDELRVVTRLTDVRHTTLRFDYDIENVTDGGRLITQGHTVLAGVTDKMKVVRLPDRLTSTARGCIMAAPVPDVRSKS